MDYPINRLDTALRAAGIPIHGCAMLDKATEPPTVRIDFRPEVTLEQIAQAQTLAADTGAAAWWRPRQKRSYASLLTGITGLTTADRTKLVNLALAFLLREHPRFVEIVRASGIDLEGEEVA